MGQGGARREVYRRGERLARAAQSVVDEYGAAVGRVRTQVAVLSERAVLSALETIPVSRLKDVTEGRLRVAALEAAEYRTVRQVYEASDYDLLRVPGIGTKTAHQIQAAAAQIARAAAESTAVRIDPDRPDVTSQALVDALFPFVLAGPGLRAAHTTATSTTAAMEALLTTARPVRGLRLWFIRPARRTAALDAVAELDKLLRQADQDGLEEAFAQAAADLLRGPGSPAEGWLEFATRSVEFYSVLGELAGTAAVDSASAEGHLPDTIAEQVHAKALDESLLRVSLRGYQAFGARYALARQRTILGDEMGLGKTVQALAALAHLAAQGETHFLVVSPASVLINWLRETETRTQLRAFRLHGPERDAGRAAWHQEGGVAVTTFEGLRHLSDAAGAPLRAAMLVVDEAHYIKNPAAQRSRLVGELTARTERVLFLTGTPMENRVEEFRALVAYLQPELIPAVRNLDAVAGAGSFRRAVAPVYLRRNQSDVLTELPEVVHTDDWQEFSAEDEAAYRTAVSSGNFMAMRRAAYAEPRHSAKLRRLVDIVGEACETGEKVIVYSFFRDVLAAVNGPIATEVGGAAMFGPISGSTSATDRQEVADRFTAAPGPAVLLAQIQAGGVGLNLQAASVVVLCEPQIKPALEHQAVARAHRMGQIRRVRVHRLLTPDSVDTRMLALLASKQRLFDAYARRSEAAESIPDALDLSEQSLARRIVEEEQLRLAGTGA